MHVKKNDNVIVITGKDKGKSGKVLRVLPKENRVLIEGINIKKTVERAKKQGDKKKMIEKAFPLHASNVRLADAPKKAAKKAAK